MKFANNIKLSTYRLLIKKRGLTIETIRNKDFSNISFDNANFDNASFDNANFDNASFDNASFDNASFDNASFYRASFDNASFYRANFDNASFDNASFYRASFDNASFYRASFDNASFYRANFDGVIGDSNLIHTIQTNIWHIVIYKNRMQIGCKNHTIKRWMSYDDNAISKMDNRAMEFWKVWKPIIVEYLNAIKLGKT